MSRAARSDAGRFLLSPREGNFTFPPWPVGREFARDCLRLTGDIRQGSQRAPLDFEDVRLLQLVAVTALERHVGLLGVECRRWSEHPDA